MERKCYINSSEASISRTGRFSESLSFSEKGSKKMNNEKQGSGKENEGRRTEMLQILNTLMKIHIAMDQTLICGSKKVELIETD
jgi:hypothetical protein